MHRSWIAGMCGILVVSAYTAFAEPVRNGNDLALSYVEAGTPEAREKASREAANGIHTFRYLQVTKIEKDQPETGLYRLETTEPSSDMSVVLNVAKRALSLDLAATLKIGDCLAVQGRVRQITGDGVKAPFRMIVDSANLRFKDRAQPKAGAETLDEVDPRAVKTAK